MQNKKVWLLIKKLNSLIKLFSYFVSQKSGQMLSFLVKKGRGIREP